ncbi:TIGR03085 family protein [Cellulomonas sp. APG4]|uniref:TIGR03085 family metal-binding protein n=1 Tax=Cellulomonas sp. APG4 TaxID=1538656 RepID=UPI00137B2EA1|nr:TIGR03085 family metal-binding protein [Cellulomonas sp. APG4]NCT89834.1 TIGR03085 family protein [Cellulomonas sp. APG4]
MPRALFHPRERTALADALADAGPGAPTLCEGWRSEHLAAHVVLRERAPLVAAGIVVPQLAARTERAISELAAASGAEAGYAALVERVRQGPGRWHPLEWSDAAQLVELFVHTEDVRRGAGPLPPRPRTPEHTEALWRGLTRMAGMLYRRSPVRVALCDGEGRVLRAGPRGASTVVVTGDVGDLVLHAYDRSAAARVTVEGALEDVAALDEVRPRPVA